MDKVEAERAETAAGRLVTNDPQRMNEFVELYSLYYPRLQYYLMAIAPTPADAADILQETSLVLWKKFSAFQSGTNFYAWACKIARLQTLKHRQRQGQSAKILDSHAFELIAADAASESMERGIPLEILEACLDKLSEIDRALIRKRYQPDYTVKKIAVEVGRSANSLSKSLGRIRRTLLECIDRKLAHNEVH